MLFIEAEATEVNPALWSVAFLWRGKYIYIDNAIAASPSSLLMILLDLEEETYI